MPTKPKSTTQTSVATTSNLRISLPLLSAEKEKYVGKTQSDCTRFSGHPSAFASASVELVTPARSRDAEAARSGVEGGWHQGSGAAVPRSSTQRYHARRC